MGEVFGDEGAEREYLCEWGIVPAKHDESHRGRDGAWPRILPEGFPIVVDSLSGAICEPILIYLYMQFGGRGATRYVENTAWSYADDLKTWMIFLEEFGLTWTEATQLNLDSYMSLLSAAVSPKTGQKYSMTTLERRRVAIRGFYGFWLKDGRLAEVAPPGSLLRVGENGKRIRGQSDDVKVIHPAEAERLLRELGPLPHDWSIDSEGETSRDRIASDIALFAGLRVKEVRNLNIAQFSRFAGMELLEKKRYQVEIVGKGNKKRKAKFPGVLLREIVAYISGERAFVAERVEGADAAALLLNPRIAGTHAGERVSVRTLERAFNAACMRAGLFDAKVVQKVDWDADLKAVFKSVRVEDSWYVFHDLRHTYAVWTYYARKKAGDTEPWLDISACLGHAFLSTTLRYYVKPAKTFSAEVTDDYMEHLNAL